MKFWTRAILINLAVILAILAVLAIFFTIPFGRPVFTTLLLLPEAVPNFPIHPLKIFSKEPQLEEATIQIPGKEEKADLYRLNDNKTHPAIIFTLGALVTREDATVTRFAEALTRLGF